MEVTLKCRSQQSFLYHFNRTSCDNCGQGHSHNRNSASYYCSTKRSNVRDRNYGPMHQALNSQLSNHCRFSGPWWRRKSQNASSFHLWSMSEQDLGWIIQSSKCVTLWHEWEQFDTQMMQLTIQEPRRYSAEYRGAAASTCCHVPIMPEVSERLIRRSATCTEDQPIDALLPDGSME